MLIGTGGSISLIVMLTLLYANLQNETYIWQYSRAARVASGALHFLQRPETTGQRNGILICTRDEKTAN